MGRVEIAVQLHRPGAAPQPLTLVGELDRPEIVQIAAFGVKQLAEETLTNDVEDHHLHAVVVAVLHHHAMLAELLGRVDDRPAVLERHRRGHLGRRVLSALHRGQHDGDVPFPWRRVVDEIEILGLAQPLEVARPACIDRRSRMTSFRNHFRGPVGALRSDVADSSDAASRNLEEIPHVTGPLPADADVGNPHRFDPRRSERRRRGL
jgi:hypothetical protein